MRLSRAGARPARVRGAPGFCAALLLSVALASCSSAGPPVRSAGWYASQAPALVAGMPPVEIEDDGLEAQRPPRRRNEQIPDDPAEPFSPNYGSGLPVGEDDLAPAPT